MLYQRIDQYNGLPIRASVQDRLTSIFIIILYIYCHFYLCLNLSFSVSKKHFGTFQQHCSNVVILPLLLKYSEMFLVTIYVVIFKLCIKIYKINFLTLILKQKSKIIHLIVIFIVATTVFFFGILRFLLFSRNIISELEMLYMDDM